MKKFSLVVFALAFISSCSDSKKGSSESLGDSFISGLASPIRLQYDSTVVMLTDYFPDAVEISTVKFAGKEWKSDVNGVVVIPQGEYPAISNMRVIYKDVAHDIPVFATEKISYIFSYRETSDQLKEVQLAGNMNGWNPKATALTKKEGVWKCELLLVPGLYEYQIVEDGNWMLDKNNIESKDNGQGGFNSTFEVGDYKSPSPQISLLSTDSIRIRVELSENLLPVHAYLENHLLTVVSNGNETVILIPEEARNISESVIRVYANNDKQRANDLYIPLKNGIPVTNAAQLDRDDLHRSIMYFMMVDRFVDGDSNNNRPTLNDSIQPKANNLGGDLEGINKKVADGYFEKLGVNTLWISPIGRNAEGAWGLWNKGATSKFSAYHGYWPLQLTTIDDRFGSDQEFTSLISDAHKSDMNVLLDYVAHHVHEDNALYEQHNDWATQLHLPDGRLNTELWDEQRLTTWFDVFLPTWDLSRSEVVEPLTDSAMFWIQQYELDGFRHDATKHIPELFWRTLTKKVKAEEEKQNGRKIFQIGETYGNTELISSYISSGMLDAQFNFNLYDAAVDAFAKPQTNFDNLVRVMQSGLKAYGSHHLMGNITGNQDRARFISYADGSVQFSEDAKLAGWTRDIQNKGKDGFAQMEMLTAFLMCAPGIPCIYYGDEIGMPGGNDPDNRRMMHFDSWNENQQHAFNNAAKLCKLRTSNLALIYGDTQVLYSDENTLVIGRSYLQSTAIFCFYKGTDAKEISFTIPAYFDTTNLHAVNHNQLSEDAQVVKLEMKGNGWEALVN